MGYDSCSLPQGELYSRRGKRVGIAAEGGGKRVSA